MNITNIIMSERCKSQSNSARFQLSRGLDYSYLDGGGRTRRWHEDTFWSVDNVLVFVMGTNFPGVSSLTNCILIICAYLGVLSFR